MKGIPDNSVTYKLILQDSPIATMPQSGGDVIECIAAFERGCKNVYLVDDLGRYSGQAITIKYWEVVGCFLSWNRLP